MTHPCELNELIQRPPAPQPPRPGLDLPSPLLGGARHLHEVPQTLIGRGLRAVLLLVAPPGPGLRVCVRVCCASLLQGAGVGRDKAEAEAPDGGKTVEETATTHTILFCMADV